MSNQKLCQAKENLAHTLDEDQDLHRAEAHARAEIRGDLTEREDGAGAGDEVPEGAGRDRVLMGATK